MITLPQEVIDHCQKYTGCKSCPVRPCEAPMVSVTDPRWDEWMGERIKAIRELSE